MTALGVFDIIDEIGIYEDGSDYSFKLYKRGENNSNPKQFRRINFKNEEYDEGEFSVQFKKLPSEEEMKVFTSEFYRELIPVVPSNVENEIRAESMANDLIRRIGIEIEEYNLPTFSKSGSNEFADLKRPQGGYPTSVPMKIDDILQELEKQERRADSKVTPLAVSNLNLNTASIGEIIKDIKRKEEERKAKLEKANPTTTINLEQMMDDIKKVAPVDYEPKRKKPRTEAKQASNMR